MALRGVRGAATVDFNEAEEILQATRNMLEKILQENPQLKSEDLASAFFTLTPDLDAVFPARAARQIGWENVPLMDALEIPVPGSLPMCIRVLLHWNTDLPQTAVQHVYLGKAVKLRPDLAQRKAA